MNDKQRKFAETYAECLNATEAAKKAGYSEKTAYSHGQRMLKNVEIAKYISELQAKLASERIADIKEVKETWTKVMRDGNQKTSDRIRAGELIAKSSGEFLAPNKSTYRQEEQEGQQEPLDNDNIDFVRVCLPVRQGEADYNAVRLPNGDIVPLPGYENEDLLIYVSCEPTENEKTEDLDIDTI